MFAKSLDEVILTVDHKELKLSELAFYVAYQEQTIEAEALIYNPDNTNEYWNLYANGTFLRDEGKQAVIEMAVHDEIFYQMAVAEGIVLTPRRRKHILPMTGMTSGAIWRRTGVRRLVFPRRNCGRVSEKLRLRRSTRFFLAQMQQKDFEEYSFTGEAYARLLEEHTYTVA